MTEDDHIVIVQGAGADAANIGKTKGVEALGAQDFGIIAAEAIVGAADDQNWPAGARIGVTGLGGEIPGNITRQGIAERI